MLFQSPSKGTLTLSEVVGDIQDFMGEVITGAYKIIIGTDSQNRPERGITTFVTAIIVHRVGKGARFYVTRRNFRQVSSLRQRMFMEASYSLAICQDISELVQSELDKWNLEIHLDVGEKGATQPLVKEMIGWVTASGYSAKVKPDSYGASKVADRYTRSMG